MHLAMKTLVCMPIHTVYSMLRGMAVPAIKEKYLHAHTRTHKHLRAHTHTHTHCLLSSKNTCI